MVTQQATKCDGRNPFFVVFKGENLAAAMERHYRHYGVGPLLLVKDFNRAPQRAAVSRRLAAA